MEDKPGYGFRPYDEELVGYYLRNKIQGNTRLVEGSISEVNICSFDPWILCLKSKIKSRDPIWYFFSRRENKYASGNRQSRTTRSGSWKLTGESVDVKDQWGIWSGIKGKIIGQKRFLVFLRGKTSQKTKSDWAMQELHYTLLPEDQRTYVICRLEYKGHIMNIPSANATDPTLPFVPNMTNSAGSVVNLSLQAHSGSFNTFSEYDSANQGQQFSGNFNMQQSFQGNSGSSNHFSEYDLANQGHWFSGDLNLQQQVPYSAPYEDDIWRQLVEDNCDSLIDERTYTQKNCSDYRPKNPVTGVFADDSSSDIDTDSTVCRDTWSSTDSVGSSDGPYLTPIDDIPLLSTIEPLHNNEAQEKPKQLTLQSQGKEKVIATQKSECEWIVAKDSVKKVPSTTAVKQSWIVLEEVSQRNSQWSHLKNMIIGFLLFISIISWIILVA
ncbi:hypothetical protein EUTSA_v10007665mg [Eutrema salsugineum]|uniref:NAC domain-containing protein n=1 Tax=Eutrema salsugineum TaxID=72664 RepID=V4KZD4_EUTSA|nr:NAC domain-containing protein 1 isoform X2 [Eutrema salsugineum]ESQ36719.1 hypothetical protein EUTSA_v10007665mg [Eutrema salsugineum]